MYNPPQLARTTSGIYKWYISGYISGIYTKNHAAPFIVHSADSLSEN